VKAFGKGHAADLKFLTWARTATIAQLRRKAAELVRQKDFPSWKRAVIARALGRLLDLEEKLNP
jgi:hypothetical protein